MLKADLVFLRASHAAVVHLFGPTLSTDFHLFQFPFLFLFPLSLILIEVLPLPGPGREQLRDDLFSITHCPTLQECETSAHVPLCHPCHGIPAALPHQVR